MKHFVISGSPHSLEALVIDSNGNIEFAHKESGAVQARILANRTLVLILHEFFMRIIQIGHFDHKKVAEEIGSLTLSLSGLNESYAPHKYYGLIRDIFFSRLNTQNTRFVNLSKAIANGFFLTKKKSASVVVLRCSSGLSAAAINVNQPQTVCSRSSWTSLYTSNGSAVDLGRKVLGMITRSANNMASEEEKQIVEFAITASSSFSPHFLDLQIEQPERSRDYLNRFFQIEQIERDRKSADTINFIAYLGDAVFAAAEIGNCSAIHAIAEMKQHQINMLSSVIEEAKLQNDHFFLCPSGFTFSNNRNYTYQVFDQLLQLNPNAKLWDLDNCLSRVVGAAQLGYLGLSNSAIPGFNEEFNETLLASAENSLLYNHYPEVLLHSTTKIR